MLLIHKDIPHMPRSKLENDSEFHHSIYLCVGRNTFLSSPQLCFIIVFICDLFVSRDDPLIS